MVTTAMTSPTARQGFSWSYVCRSVGHAVLANACAVIANARNAYSPR